MNYVGPYRSRQFLASSLRVGAARAEEHYRADEYQYQAEDEIDRVGPAPDQNRAAPPGICQSPIHAAAHPSRVTAPKTVTILTSLQPHFSK